MKKPLLLCAVLTLAACASPPPPVTFKPLDYSYLRPITFKVSNLNIVNNYTPTPDEVQLNASNPAPPAATLMAMLNNRMQPSGQPGTGTITVQVASENIANGMLNGQMTVDINLTSADGRATGFAEASVSASATAPDPGDQNATQTALYQMTKRMMDAINVQLPYQIAHNIPGWVAWTTGGGAAMPAGGAPGAIQSAPLLAPGAAAPVPGGPAAPVPLAPANTNPAVPNYLPGAGPATLAPP